MVWLVVQLKVICAQKKNGQGTNLRLTVTSPTNAHYLSTPIASRPLKSGRPRPAVGGQYFRRMVCGSTWRRPLVGSGEEEKTRSARPFRSGRVEPARWPRIQPGHFPPSTPQLSCSSPFSMRSRLHRYLSNNFPIFPGARTRPYRSNLKLAPFTCLGLEVLEWRDAQRKAVGA